MCAYIAQADILHHLRIKSALSDYLLQDLEDKGIEVGVLETALLCLGQRRPDGQGDNNIIWVLGGAV
jgi:hypothetical protein